MAAVEKQSKILTICACKSDRLEWKLYWEDILAYMPGRKKVARRSCLLSSELINTKETATAYKNQCPD